MRKLMIVRYKDKIIKYLESKIRLNHVAKSMKLIYGEKYFNLNQSDIAVIAVGRNMSYYLDYFYEYHRALGATHFLYVDNGSSDESFQKLRKWKNAIILSTDVNFKHFQPEIRQIAVKKYISEGWKLAIDPDELFDYAGSDHLNLVELTKLLNHLGYTGLVAQMLDLVSNDKIAGKNDTLFEDATKSHIYYNVDNIESYDYLSKEIEFSDLVENNILPNDDISWKFGGIRKEYFGEHCCLTKHPLFYHDNSVRAFVHPHLTTGLKLADFTAVLKHYKFSGDFLSREKLLLRQDRISHGETSLRMSFLEDNPDFSFNTNKFKKLNCINDLLNDNFITISDRSRKLILG